MQAWQWIVLGAFLLSAEMFVDAEFYLVFLGVSAVLVGLVGLTPIEVPFWGQWLLFSVFVIASVRFFRKQFYDKYRGEIPDRSEGAEGEVADANGNIAVGGMGKVTLRGATWSAKNVGNEAIAAGSRVVVIESAGLTLSVCAESEWTQGKTENH
jgi:membrane protein implicated in regulation of membrane protease activity